MPNSVILIAAVPLGIDFFGLGPVGGGYRAPLMPGPLGVMMSSPILTTFFYGSYINRDVLLEIGLAPERFEVARLPGYDISIRPLANLVPSDEHTVYGVLASTTHAELDRLYKHAEEVLGGVYLPHPVLAWTMSGQAEPVLCYIAPSLSASQPEPAYVNRILKPARELGFPAWYLARLESFIPEARAT